MACQSFWSSGRRKDKSTKWKTNGLHQWGRLRRLWNQSVFHFNNETPCPADIFTVTRMRRRDNFCDTLKHTITVTDQREASTNVKCPSHLLPRPWALQVDTFWRQVKKTGVSGFFESVNGRLVDQTTDCFYVTMMPSLVAQFVKAQRLRCQCVAAKEAVCLLGEGCGDTDRSTLGHCLRAYVLHL